jgi:hypothetical protein
MKIHSIFKYLPKTDEYDMKIGSKNYRSINKTFLAVDHNSIKNVDVIDLPIDVTFESFCSSRNIDLYICRRSSGIVAVQLLKSIGIRKLKHGKITAKWIDVYEKKLTKLNPYNVKNIRKSTTSIPHLLKFELELTGAKVKNLFELVEKLDNKIEKMIRISLIKFYRSSNKSVLKPIRLKNKSINKSIN